MPKGQKPLLGVLSKRDGNKKRKQTTTIFSLVFIQSLLISLHYSTPRPPFFAPFRTNVPPELFDWLICLIFFLLISLLNFGIPVYYHHCFDKNFYKIISYSFSVPCIWLWWNTKNLSFQKLFVNHNYYYFFYHQLFLGTRFGRLKIRWLFL